MNYYLSFKQYLLNLHGVRIWRVPLSTGMPCPNRINGKKGCTFCDGRSFIAPYMKGIPVEEQLRLGMNFFGEKFQVNFFYGYFQENTSTYGCADGLLEKFETALKNERIKGLLISTRPDYVDREIIRRLEILRDRYKKDIWMEIGLQSTDDKTLERINRGHSYKDFKEAARLINEISCMKVCVHIIMGLPGESPEKILGGIIRLFRENKLNGLKLRLLDILPETLMEKDFMENSGDFYRFGNEEYVTLLCDIFERIPENIVIMRTLNYNPVNILNKEKKIMSKDEILSGVIAEFRRRNTRQGIYFDRNLI